MGEVEKALIEVEEAREWTLLAGDAVGRAYGVLTTSLAGSADVQVHQAVGMLAAAWELMVRIAQVCAEVATQLRSYVSKVVGGGAQVRRPSPTNPARSRESSVARRNVRSAEELAAARRRRPRHPRKELEAVIRAAEKRGWWASKTNYYQLRCPCGRHGKTIHLTPSNPNYERNLRNVFENFPCWGEEFL